MGKYKPHKEKEIENEIKEYISSRGGLCYKIHGGDLYQERWLPREKERLGNILLAGDDKARRNVLRHRSKRPGRKT